MATRLAKLVFEKPTAEQSRRGANFHRAVAATAPGETLLTVRRPVRNGPAVRYQPCFCAENYNCA